MGSGPSSSFGLVQHAGGSGRFTMDNSRYESSTSLSCRHRPWLVRVPLLAHLPALRQLPQPSTALTTPGVSRRRRIDTRTFKSPIVRTKTEASHLHGQLLDKRAVISHRINRTISSLSIGSVTIAPSCYQLPPSHTRLAFTPPDELEGLVLPTLRPHQPRWLGFYSANSLLDLLLLHRFLEVESSARLPLSYNVVKGRDV
ncbi:hypothetical protein F4861DRAFT_30164 [Xylaria intraflava]|nr:hypothetical protein F4861DRAFT_30164 [Xylaria intraflava]